MTHLIGALLIVVGIQAAAIVALLVQRTRRIQVERDLREREERVRLVADRAPVMIWTARPDTTLDYLNRTCVEFTGLPMEKLRDEGWLDAVHPEDRDYCAGTYGPAFEARTPFFMEYRVRRADGAYRWLLASGVPKYGPDGSFEGYIGCDVDITERKDAETRTLESRTALEASHREVQHLAGRLIEAQDAERARIARDLHDDVSQQLAGLSIALSGLKHRLDERQVSEELQADLRALHQRATTLAQNVRHVSHDLHPTVLRHAGLEAALTSYCAELQRLHGTVLTCSAEGDFASIPPAVALCLYRIAQEALRNVIAHAAASRADVRLLRTSDTAEITITDDGKGFDVTSSLERGKGLGLVSITERVRLAGGTVSVAAESKKGTRLFARIPAHALVKTDGGSGPEGGRRELSVP
jgi:PAS domain S-box-containing protein